MSAEQPQKPQTLYLKAPHVRAWGEMTPCDLRASDGAELRIGLRCGTGIVWAVSGEYVPMLGLLALTVGRDGRPIGVHIPDEPHTIRILAAAQAEDEDDGA